MSETNLDEIEARNLVNEANYDLRVVIVMNKVSLSRGMAENVLEENDFVLEKAIEIAKK